MRGWMDEWMSPESVDTIRKVKNHAKLDYLTDSIILRLEKGDLNLSGNPMDGWMDGLSAQTN